MVRLVGPVLLGVAVASLGIVVGSAWAPAARPSKPGPLVGAKGAPPPAVPEPPPLDLVDVAAPREMRGLWVATVFNLDFPSRRGLSPARAEAELVALVRTAAEAGFNTLVFQVRPEGDAFYRSKLEPWSRYLTGTQGRDPGYDPLGTLVREAHERGLEVHAWFNPYRAAARRGDALADNHVAREVPAAVRPWGNTLWLDPGLAPVQERALDVIDEVVRRYDIDGVHIDDYFYPYPDGSRAFPDGSTYQAYRSAGGALTLADWRRDNVDRLVERIHDRVEAACPTCRMGVSPFGIYRPGQPVGARGLDQVAQLFADPMLWYREGWVDYLAPQLYWSTRKSGQAYGLLLKWWDAHVEAEHPLVVGLDATKVGSNATWSLDEVRTQVRLAREAPNTHGQIWFRAKPILTDQAGLRTLLAGELYAQRALPPVQPGAPAPPPPLVEVNGNDLRLAPAEGTDLRGYVLYRGAEPRFDRLLPPVTTVVELPSGPWVVSAVGPGAAESRGLRVLVGPTASGGAL